MKPPRFFIIILIFLLVAFVFVALMFLRGDEDTWLCQDGQWVAHGSPSALKPQTPCE